MRRLLALLVLVASTAGRAAAQQAAAPLGPNQWRVDNSHSGVNFRIRHLGITWVNGAFRQWTGELTYDPDHPEAASVTAHIQATSVDTENERRDADVRDNYLEVAKFPEIVFVSRKVEKVAADKLRITGDFTLHGVTKSVVLDTDVSGVLNNSQMGRRVSFSATTTLKRQDFGIARNAILEGAQVVGDDVKVSIDLEAVQPTKK